MPDQIRAPKSAQVQKESAKQHTGHSPMTEAELLALDEQHIWHPYAPLKSSAPIFAIESAKGVHLHLKDGRKVIDGMSSWWSALHGYQHPELDKAVKDQLSTMAHVMFGGLTHEPAVRLAKTLVDITPHGLNRVFFSDSGSVAVEVALKMALQYWQAKGENRTTFLSFSKGYHGDTIGAMSVCDPITGMHSVFSDYIAKNIFSESPRCSFDTPWNESYLDDFKTQLLLNKRRLAAVIIEPIVQGTGGMNFYSPTFLKRIREITEELNIPLIVDEIATGFGRTGELFACNHANIKPDIMCLGKTLSAGYITLAATLCTDKIATTICQGDAGVFMHGPTFMANPLACSVAQKSIDILLESNWQENVLRMQNIMKIELNRTREHKAVKSVRVLGSIGVIEMKENVDQELTQTQFIDRGIWLRPFGRLIYMIPPYIISNEELETLCRKTIESIEAIYN
ncbi:MAG: adenosylmethionine-8-amino-7-oxononanoate aminotransferase [Flavobacteriales bacterium]|jgi:adenosylmethionine-8-amino-7-oxononanoate aminotransferase